MPPKGSGRKKGAASDGSATPHLPSLAEQLSYGHLPRPFKNPNYTKNVNRRAKNLKAVLSQEREREKAQRERTRLRKAGKTGGDEQAPTNKAEDGMQVEEGDGTDEVANADAMDVDVNPAEGASKSGDAAQEEDEEIPSYTSIEAPPSVWPPKHYCDITGLEAPYTDPATGLRFHDISVYQLIKGLSASTAKEYLAARGVSTVVK